MLRIFITVTALFFLAGCGHFSAVDASNTNTYGNHLYSGVEYLEKQSRYNEESSNVILAQAAASVSQSLQELAKIQRSVQNVSRVREDPSLQHLKITGRTSLDWTGPVDTLLAKIALHAKVKFVSFGNKPALPIIVSVNEKDISLANLIRNISYMVQNQALVTYKNNTIELRYF